MQPLVLLIAFTIGIMVGARATLAMINKTPTNTEKVAAILASNERLKAYQIALSIDSAYVYDNGKFIGATAHGYDGIDSVIMKDNE